MVTFVVVREYTLGGGLLNRPGVTTETNHRSSSSQEEVTPPSTRHSVPAMAVVCGTTMLAYCRDLLVPGLLPMPI